MHISLSQTCVSTNSGRKRGCLLFCAFYTIGCLTKHIGSFQILFLGRLCCGVATSLLYCAFESWMVHEHHQTHHFSKDQLSTTFAFSSFGNSVVAIASGVVAYFVKSWFGTVIHRFLMKFKKIIIIIQYVAFLPGPVAPFDLSIVLLLVTAGVVFTTWTENYGSLEKTTTTKSKTHSQTVMMRALHTMFEDPRILFLGLAQGLFEGGMFVFVFMWTPTLEHQLSHSVPHGIVFASFMMACMIGSTLYKV